MRRERLVPLTDELPESEGFPLHTCNWCDERPETKAVVALELVTKHLHRYYGVCGNHAEVLNVTPEWQER